MFDVISVIGHLLCTYLLVLSLMILYVHRLLSACVYMTIFSLIMALLYLLLNAPDVSMTEATVGMGLSGIFMFHALSVVGTTENELQSTYFKWANLFILIALLGVLIYIVLLLPPFGASGKVIDTYLTPFYIENTKNLMGFPNLVTAILAGFRGYDTFGETTVIVTAATCIWLILRGKLSHKNQD